MFSWLLVESPRYLSVNIAKYSKSRVALEYISNINRKPMFEEHLEGEILNEYSETIRKRQNMYAQDNSELRDESGIRDESGLRDASEIRDISEIRDDSNRDASVPFEYLGGAANAVDRENDLDRGHKLGYRDLFKEESRKDVAILCGL